MKFHFSGVFLRDNSTGSEEISMKKIVSKSLSQKIFRILKRLSAVLFSAFLVFGAASCSDGSESDSYESDSESSSSGTSGGTSTTSSSSPSSVSTGSV